MGRGWGRRAPSFPGFCVYWEVKEGEELRPAVNVDFHGGLKNDLLFILCLTCCSECVLLFKFGGEKGKKMAPSVPGTCLVSGNFGDFSRFNPRLWSLLFPP